jgi:DNA-binding NarL/FixJ family response regulator
MIHPISKPKRCEGSQGRKITVILVDDHSLMRDSLRTHLENETDIEVIAEATNGEEAIELATKLNPDVMIMDIAMPKMNGLEATRQITLLKPEIAVLALTVHDDIEYILKVLEAGAKGYVTKDIEGDKFSNAIRLVNTGESVLSEEVLNKLLKHAFQYAIKPSLPTGIVKLSNREFEIFNLAAQGMSNKQIGERLNINLRTVKSHFVNIFSKLNANSRTEAVINGIKMGLIKPDDIG